MAWFTDSLRTAIASVNPLGRGVQQAAADRYFTPQLAFAAYLSSGLLRKVIDIPAADRVREWRDWQAEKEQIEALEALERELGIVAKVKACEVLRGIGGGALVMALPGAIDQPAPMGGKLAAANVASRWQLQLLDINDNMADVAFGCPRMFRINGGTRGQQDIHPSRVVAFRGDPIPAGFGVSPEDAYWGASRLERVMSEVQRSDSASQWFAELVKKAKLLRFGVSNLTDYNQDDLDSRVALIATGENSLNATIYNLPAKDGAGNEAGGEKIDDYQVSWTGIPAMMDAFDQRVAAVADIPFTRLMGRSPAGMNATGESDQANWNKAIVAGQKLEMRPCLDQMDAFLIPTAGVDPAKVTWRFAPLDTPSEKDEATTFKTVMEAVEKVQATGAIPDVAFTKGVQNLLSEREWMPGLDQALAEIPEAERFGLTPDPDETDPSALAEGGDRDLAGGRADGSVPARRAANDAKPRTLYVSRKVLNVGDLRAWATAQGLPDLQDDLHVTIAYSTTPVDWIAMGATWADHSGKGTGDLLITAGGPRVVEPLGNRTAVLMFASSDLSWRNREMREAGASWDWPDYQPHISLTGDLVDLSEVEPYRGVIRLGPEIFEEIDAGRQA